MPANRRANPFLCSAQTAKALQKPIEADRIQPAEKLPRGSLDRPACSSVRRMGVLEWMILKAVVLVIAVAIYGFWLGRKDRDG